MAPISLSSPCQSNATAGDAANLDGYLTKKRASIHYPDVVPEFPEKKDGSTSTCSSSSTTSTETPSSPVVDTSRTNSSREMNQEQRDQELLNTLTSFLRGEGNAVDCHPTAKDCRTINDGLSAVTASVGTKTESGLSQSAGPTNEGSELCDLVVTIRDFAYPTAHPYHCGLYPPEPAYEESDIEEDDETEEDYDEQDQDRDSNDRTQGHARGLYDFDAENSSELSFQEGEFLWVHCRQFPGWFLGEMNGKTGLVPENYVQLL
ncbi:Rho GTPase activating protein 10 [Gamsiella multidivaricata]|nr:Rho GTPase activating protein 10 [Gamsiella multidivaricata]